MAVLFGYIHFNHQKNQQQQKSKGGYTIVTLRRTVTPYRDSVDGLVTT